MMAMMVNDEGIHGQTKQWSNIDNTIGANT
jgi:hypothetical protein